MRKVVHIICWPFALILLAYILAPLFSGKGELRSPAYYLVTTIFWGLSSVFFLYKRTVPPVSGRRVGINASIRRFFRDRHTWLAWCIRISALFGGFVAVVSRGKGLAYEGVVLLSSAILAYFWWLLPVTVKKRPF